MRALVFWFGLGAALVNNIIDN